MILFLRFRRATLLLTRGMVRSLHHQQTLETVLVALRHQRGLAQATLPLGMLLGQDVPLVRVVAAQPARPREPDALAERALGFLFRHVVASPGHGPGVSSFIWAPTPSTYCGLRASGPARSWRCPSALWRPGRAPRAPGRCGPSVDPGTSWSPSPCCSPAATPARAES